MKKMKKARKEWKKKKNIGLKPLNTKPLRNRSNYLKKRQTTKRCSICSILVHFLHYAIFLFHGGDRRSSNILVSLCPRHPTRGAKAMGQKPQLPRGVSEGEKGLRDGTVDWPHGGGEGTKSTFELQSGWHPLGRPSEAEGGSRTLMKTKMSNILESTLTRIVTRRPDPSRKLKKITLKICNKYGLTSSIFRPH